jgi:cysteine desulfurase/selenocysteine lyase
MPPWHGGGEMIVSVTYERATYKPAPQKFEAGTPNIADAIGLGAAVDYLESIGRSAIFAHDSALTAQAMADLQKIPGVRLLGPAGSRGALVAFHADWAHPHDLTTYANQQGLALRGGHHCTQPLMRKLRLPGTTRASFYFYNTAQEVERMGEIMRAARKFFDR